MPSTPEFVMPPQVASVEPPVTVEPTAEVARPTAHPHALALDERVDRPRLPWRQLTAAALVGVLVGAGVPSAFEAVDRASADAEVQGLRSLAADYLTAIAEGEAARATALVPVEGELPPDDVLRSADPMREAAVQVVSIDGDQARVDVRFRVGSETELRVLAAERGADGWRLTTSLAEEVWVHSFDGTTGVSLGGVPLAAQRRVLLYPGVYTSDVVETPLLRSGGDRFEVDGDPGSPTDLSADPMLKDEFRDAAVEVANARVRGCLAQQACPFEPTTAVPDRAELFVSGVDPVEGAIDLIVPLGLVGTQWYDMRVRALVDESGALVSWECGRPDRPHHALEACGA